jgi:hypothetical protein
MPRQPPPEIIIGNHRIIYRDDDITIYPAEGKEALCADGRHLIVVLNRHLTSVYELVSRLRQAVLTPRDLQTCRFSPRSSPRHSACCSSAQRLRPRKQSVASPPRTFASAL